ncbi:MAG: alanine racemase, partial [Sphingomonadales bacterium]
MIARRQFLAGAGALLAAGAAASPVLVADNHRLTLARAARRNGWVEVDAQAFETNIDTVRRLIGPARLCAVLKADAYGNGIALLMKSFIAKRITEVAITAN